MAARTNPSLKRFMEELRHHLKGWRAKIEADFSKTSFSSELKELKTDPVYSNFHLASADYVFVRLLGRMSVSIGRRLGELYDKIPRFLAQERFNLMHAQVVAKFDGLELDIHLKLADLNSSDKSHLIQTVRKHYRKDISNSSGLAIEIRYNFNPNDSARLRKDKHLVKTLLKLDYYPLYLIFAENSPRLQDAVASLSRAGWNFSVGTVALNFMAELLGFDITKILETPQVSAEIKREVDSMMEDIWNSYAFKQLGLRQDSER